jgi:bifunctional DNA-binding transcriptional regulator/antitoxin component of YhaV-PrlF toxin-antitoxin module
MVIPADVRKQFTLESGDRFVIVGVPEFGTIGLVKADLFSKLADEFMSQASAFARFAQDGRMQPAMANSSLPQHLKGAE